MKDRYKGTTSEEKSSPLTQLLDLSFRSYIDGGQAPALSDVTAIILKESVRFAIVSCYNMLDVVQQPQENNSIHV